MTASGRQALEAIAVVTEGLAAPRAAAASGNVPLLLTEIRHALERLLADGSAHTIDLRAIPLGPGEEDALIAALGEGELSAEFDALGRSAIRECAYPGVWRITHQNAAGEAIGHFIEITYAPTLLSSPAADVQAGLNRLTTELDTR